MPTRIATLGRERRIATLARRLFEIEGPPSGEAQRRAETALLRANPHLAGPDGFQSGAVVAVPAVAGLRQTESVLTSRADGQGLTDEARLRLQSGRAAISARFAGTERRGEELRAQLSDQTFLRRVREAMPEALPLVAAANQQLEADLAANRDRREAFEAGIEQALAAISALQDLAQQPQS